MTPERRSSLRSQEELFSEFPFLKEWLTNNSEAIVYNGERVPSGQEKIETFGGTRQLKEIIESLDSERKTRYVILSACYRQPLPDIEIFKFGYEATEGEYLLPIFTFYITTNDLEKEGFLERVSGIIIISRKNSQYDVSNQRGWVTNENGLHERLRVSQAQKTSQLIGKPVLLLQPR